ncbi:hypothetical protein [Streptomyces sp. NBC_01618]|uniref:hypothetical protein n=1 Tax=Streptomyces sp. NBC_01618 TaxID=2975900 RepID=UPI003868270D|nr:hypothetical protein OH735_26370 [Streptomyces sp. NBC_01618]
MQCWFRERGCAHRLAREAGVSQATGYRYLYEGIDLLAAQAWLSTRPSTAADAKAPVTSSSAAPLIAPDRVAGGRDNGNDLWFSQKNKAFGGNVQIPGPRPHSAMGLRR